ncbi:MAG: hypothetical protein GKR96_06910 [Gammaproteobacteria bacterium]|nr:hypothetical protein [Gammaproteobacteria bacterium]
MFKKSLVTMSVLGGFLIGSLSFADSDYTLDTESKKFSYSVGMKVGQQILQQFLDPRSGVELEALAEGVLAMMKNQTPLITDEEANQVIEKRQELEMQKIAAESEAYKALGEAFLSENGKKEGVTTTESGLQYSVVNQGDAAGNSPGPDDTVVVHYEGTLIDGTIFDSSYERGEPATFSLNGIVKGWTEALQLMKVGDKWKVVLPSELAYGQRGAGEQIGPNATLVFLIELLEVKTSPN